MSIVSSLRDKPKRFLIPEDGYLLPNGYKLTRCIADKIGMSAGLDTTHVDECDLDYIKKPYFINGEECGSMTISVQEYYRPYITESSQNTASIPPLLVFLRVGNHHIEEYGSKYTINLRTLKPTKNSPCQEHIRDDILSELGGTSKIVVY